MAIGNELNGRQSFGKSFRLWRGRARLHQSGLRAILLSLRSDPADRQRPAAHLLVLEARVGSKDPLRAGASDSEVEALLRWAVAHKELKHKINDPGFVRASRSMSQIGG
jgi:hypothetical protein